MLHYTRWNMLSRDEHSSLFGPFGSYEENEVLRIRSLGCIHNTSYSLKLINVNNKGSILRYTRQYRLSWRNTLTYFALLDVTKMIQCYLYLLWAVFHNTSFPL
jgi:hypothetical protein